MGMGLAYTGVADDASAIYYNPGGLAFIQSNMDVVAGAMLATNLEGEFQSAVGVEEQRAGNNILPQAYGVGTLWNAKVGLGINTPFGLPMRWENPATFSGRFSSYTANVKTINFNPTVAFKFGPNIGAGIGLDYMYSKIQLERFIPAGATTPLNVAQIRIKSDLFENSGLGWNAGLLWRSGPNGQGPWSLGASYRSSIEIDHEGTADFQVLFPTVAPQTPHDVDATIEFPASMNFGGAYRTPGGTIFSLEADRTDWTSFGELEVHVDGLPPQPPRVTDWEDTWAYRAGVEIPFGNLRLRGGYYNDSTPQPLFDVGPVLPDADRTGYTVGVGFPVGPVSVDLAYVYVQFDDRTTTVAGSTDRLAGTWKTTGNEFAFNIHWQP